MKKLFKKNKDLKIKDLRDQLSRTYLIIAVLSIVSIVLFRFGANLQNESNAISAIIVVIGFGILAILSLIASFTWVNCKK